MSRCKKAAGKTRISDLMSSCIVERNRKKKESYGGRTRDLQKNRFQAIKGRDLPLYH